MNVLPYRICPGCRAQWPAHDPAYDRCPTCGAAVPRLQQGAYGQAGAELLRARKTFRATGLVIGLVVGVLCIVGGIVLSIVIRANATPVRARPGR